MQFYYMKDLNEEDLPDTAGVKLVEESGNILFVPCDEKNSHWKIYQEWLLDEENEIQSEPEE